MESRLEKDIHLPKGFRFGSICAGIKESGKKDLSFVFSEKDSVAAGLYTQNIVHAASIDWCQAITPCSNLRGIIINSGNANACTGEVGKKNNQRLAEIAAEQIDCRPEQILVLSTGIIGHQLPMDRIESQFADMNQAIGTGPQAAIDFCHGICTTDQFLKMRSTSWNDNGTDFNIIVIAKGAGMIGPNMATMLAVVLTDFPLTDSQAQQSLQHSVNKSFNCIRVDGHTSTNDAVLLLSNVDPTSPTREEASIQEFQKHLDKVTADCAKLIPIDGEGASRIVELTVSGCNDFEEAKQIAFSISDSPLVKTAIFGCDPNWGRIVSAAGYSGVNFNPQDVTLTIEDTLIYQNEVPLEFDEKKLSNQMRAKNEIQMDLNVGNGPGRITVWASDLTTQYVTFNSDYST